MFSAASGQLDIALDAAPSSTQLHLQRAEVAGQLHDWPTMLRHAGRALKLSPKNLNGYRLHADALFHLEEIEQAMKCVVLRAVNSCS